MPNSITITLNEDEAEIVVDALDSAIENQEDARDDARANSNRVAVEATKQAIARLKELQDRVQAELGE